MFSPENNVGPLPRELYGQEALDEGARQVAIFQQELNEQVGAGFRYYSYSLLNILA